MRRRGIYTRALWLHGKREKMVLHIVYNECKKSIELSVNSHIFTCREAACSEDIFSDYTIHLKTFTIFTVM